MKGLFCFLSAMLISSVAIAYTGFGICNFGKESLSDIVCYGPAVLKDTTIKGDMKIAGSVKAESISVGRVTIAGDASIQSAKINGMADIIGRLNANGVEFVKDVNITASASTLIHTKVGGSIKITSQTQKPYLVLACGTTISGSITFDGKAGVVQITDDSLIQGKIINGSQEFIKKKCD